MITELARWGATEAQARGRRGEEPAAVNVSRPERLASVAGGGTLLLYGLSRRSLSGLGLAIVGGMLVHRGATGHCLLYSQLGVDTSGYSNRALGVRARHGCKVETSIAILRPADELYRFWRNLENLPTIMSHLERVEPLDEVRSRWTAKAALGADVSWEAEIINDREGELIAWRSVPGSQVDTAGSVHFESAGEGRGTVIRVSLKYDPPGGRVGAGLAALLGGSVESRVREDLRRLRSLLEAGEIPSTDGQPHGNA